MTLLNDMAAAIINGDIKKIAYLNLQIRNDDLDLSRDELLETIYDLECAIEYNKASDRKIRPHLPSFSSYDNRIRLYIIEKYNI